MNGRKQRGPRHVHVEDVITCEVQWRVKERQSNFFLTHRIKLIKINDHVLVKFFFLQKGKSYTLELLVQISFNLKEKERKHLYSPETNV